MDEKATALTIARMLIEVAARTTVSRKTTKLKQQLENKLKRLFAQQGVAYLRKFAAHQHHFKEALTDIEIDQLFDVTATSVRMVQAIESAVEAGLELGADDLATQLDAVAFDVIFNLKNPRAVEYLKNYGVDRVSQLDTFSKDTLKNILTKGIDAGQSYGKLTTQIKKQFGDWSTKRAKLVAVTEMGNAYQRGNLIVGLDLADAGLQMEKSWLTRGDDLVDPHCKANQDDGWIDVTKAHSSGAMTPLDHPRCRCVELYRRKPAKTTSDVKITSKSLPEDSPILKRYGSQTDNYRVFTDPSSADSVVGETYYRTWADALSEDEFNAVRGYQSQTFSLVNDTLRGHRLDDEKTPYAKAQIKLLDKVLAASRTPYNLTAYRGFVNPDLAAGDTFTDLGFSSTSLAPNIAVARAGAHTHGAVARIRIPQGTTGAYIETVSPIDQAEMLLPRSTKFKVIGNSVETIAGKEVNVVDLEVIP